MIYPYGPYGQRAPGHSNFPQQRGYPPQGGYSGDYRYPPGRPASPGGGTAITAAVFAGLGVLPMLGLGVLLLAALGSRDPEPTWGASTSRSSDVGAAIFVVAALAVFVAGILLAVGALTLMQRKMVGRWLVAGGSAIAVLVSLLILGGLAALLGGAAGIGFVAYNAPALLGLIFPIATFVLALMPSTTAWIRVKPNVPPPPHRPFQPPPYPGYRA